MRTVARLEGLALEGTADFGPLRLRIPTVLEAVGPGESATGPHVTSPSAPSGSRRLVIGDGPIERELVVPILAPEVTPPGTGVTPLGDGAVYLHAPFDTTALRELRSGRPELLILGNARALWYDGVGLIEALRAIRTEVGAEPLLWAPRVALPNRLGLLAYLGIDLVDTTEGTLRAASGELLDACLGPRRVPDGTSERGCDCSACTGAPPGSLEAHARSAYRRAQLELRAALGRGALRELVEAHLASEPVMVELLRYADRTLGELLDTRTPVTAEGVHPYVLAEATRRPEMRRFRARLLERYRPPPSKMVLLLVPCSRTKPYRRSPSHRRFAQAWEGLPNLGRLHVVSVSSPIGLVPRELEDVPPARQYDIPVTGDWSAEERELVLCGVRHLLGSGGYHQIVAHLDPAEYGFLLETLPPSDADRVTVVDGRTTSPASIARLREALTRGLQATPPPSAGPLGIVAEELREIASVQFGRTAAERLFAPPVRLEGRPWFQRITDGHLDLASLREERGLFHLTVAGALRLGDALARVDVEPTLTLEGDVFAPGVLGGDPSIRTGDAVGLFQDGRLAAVGEAVLPGPLLGDLRRGVAVLVRHRRRSPSDRAKTDGAPPGAGR